MDNDNATQALTSIPPESPREKELDDIWDEVASYFNLYQEAREFGRRMWELGRENGAASAAIATPPPEPAAPAEHPSVAWWAACPVITDRPPTKADGDIFGGVFVWSGNAVTGFRVEHWEVVAHCGASWIHTAPWTPPYPQPLTLGQRIDAELAANAKLSPELRAILIEAKSVVGEVVK